MAKKKLTKKLIDSVELPAIRPLRIFDTECTGFLVTVYPSGKRTFAIVYGPSTRRVFLTIGVYGVLTVEMAREMARQRLAEVLQGRDPRSEKDERNKRLTFSKWVEEYLALTKERKKSHRVDVWYLQKISIEEWGSLPMEELTAKEVARFMGVLAEKRGKTTANRWLASLRACLAEAWRQERLQQNVAMRVKLYPENPPRSRTLNQVELARVYASLEKFTDKYAKAAILLLIETGARSSEVLRAKWEDINVKERRWRLPSPKAGKPQFIPLADSTVDLLEKLPHQGPFVIPGKNPLECRSDLKRPWEFIREDAALDGVNIHDIRRTFGLQVTRTSGLHVASKLLRHSSIAVTEKVYAPLGIDELRQATDNASKRRTAQLEATLQAALGGEDRAKAEPIPKEPEQPRRRRHAVYSQRRKTDNK